MVKSRLLIALGSNSDHEECMKKAKDMIAGLFGNNVVFTKTMWTSPVGIKSDMFLNCLALTRTELDFIQTERALKGIEASCGNTKEYRMMNIVKMDIDILLFGNDIFHAEDWERGYVKELVGELDCILP